MEYRALILLISLMCISFSSLNVTLYYSIGCPHCANTEIMLEGLSEEYGLNIITKEVSQNPSHADEVFDLYDKFGVSKSEGGVPTTLVNDEALVVGGMSEYKWRSLLADCVDGGCTPGFYTNKGFVPLGNENQDNQLTLTVLVGAALIDSINPCTIAVMVMLLGVIMLTNGKGRALVSGSIFSLVVFLMYLLMGLGILHAITSAGITNLFFTLVTVAALVLSLMEFNAYLRYKPGFFSVEMPMFLRPHVKSIMKKAVSLPGVVGAAMVCSLFLLPCSSGPYLLVLGMMAKSVTAESLFYLILYNIIFILPMLAITLLVSRGIKTADEMGDLKNRYIKEIHLISGIILFALFLIMLNQILNFV